jgi:hypothetical protein
MKKTVLIVAPSEDTHALTVSSILRSLFDTEAIIWDNSCIPTEDAASFILRSSNISFEIKSLKEYISLDSLCSIWWRRPRTFKLDVGITDPKVHEYCLRECEAFFKGIIDSLDVPIINNPLFEIAASRKPLQLKVAQKVGLSIPETIMSNDPDEIIKFWKKMNGNCIYKAFNSPSWQLVETRMLKEDDLNYLDKLRHSPIIVQEKIEKGLDIRVNIFGEKVFAGYVNTSIQAAQSDWRLDLNAKWNECLLPVPMKQNLISLLRRLGLHYGCIDLRQKPDGTYVFLEVNPSGQFIFLEVDTGQPITKSFAELLLNP